MSTLVNINDHPAQANNEHDSRGRFNAGNNGGPGNPVAGRSPGESVSEEDVKAIMQSLVELAKEGHWRASKLLLAYTLGKTQSLSEEFIAGECEPGLADAPSANGEIGAGPPSANGEIGAGAPSANGEIGAGSPSANGEIGAAPPSANGEIGAAPPSANGEIGEGIRKAHRLAKQQRNTPKPASVG